MSTGTGERRLARARGALSAREWTHVGGMTLTILGLNVVGWLVLIVLVVPRHLSLGSGVFGVGIGVTAYTLGLRHAFDADHIAAIDNTTRKLMSDGKRPLSIGFWFSLGHSTIVFLIAFLLSVGIKALAGPVAEDSSPLHHVAGIVGTAVSGSFLYLIAAINLVVLIGIVRIFKAMRQGVYDEAALEVQLESRGFMNRIFGRLMRSITRPWHMYPVGVLFGLGFETATEVTLLVLASGGAAAGLPWYAILVLPVLFAAGMSIPDTIDGTFMNFAYRWAFSNPVKKVYYNLTITGLSIAVAFLIGTIELLSLVGQELHLEGGLWGWVSRIDLGVLGYLIVSMFVVTWVGALCIWRFGRVEERWARRLTPAGEVGSS